MPGRSGGIWAGRIIAVAAVVGLVVYLSVVGLDRAEKLASVLGVLVALIALVAPYVLPPLGHPQVPPGPAVPPPPTGGPKAVAASAQAGRIDPWAAGVSVLVGVVSVAVMAMVTDDWLWRLSTGAATGVICWVVSAAVGALLDRRARRAVAAAVVIPQQPGPPEVPHSMSEPSAAI